MARRRLLSVGSVGLVALGLLGAWGCENPPPAERRTAPPGSADEVPPPAPATAPAASQPAVAPPPDGVPPTVPATSPASGATVEPEPQPPQYLTILERFEPNRRATADARTEPGNRLVIDTHNVRRLRIDRGGVPLAPNQSIALQLDQQVLEWLADSPVVEFERSVNGAWSPVRPQSLRRR